MYYKMRMWMVNPKIMCNKHLCGEHVELHMIVGTLKRGKSMDGYVLNNLLEYSSIIERHKEISNEMINRNFNHNSILINDYEDKVKDEFIRNSKVNNNNSLKELLIRCEKCKQRYEEINNEQKRTDK